MPGRKILTISKDRPERLWNRTIHGHPADEILVDPVSFKRPVQPLRPGRVAVAIAEKGAVSESGYLGHAALPDKPSAGVAEKRSRARRRASIRETSFRGRT